jgi:DNA polymerase-1
MKDKNKTLLIFDGHNVAIRAYHALSKQNDILKNKDGDGTWGIYGFFTTLIHFVNRYNPDQVAIAFDWGQSEKRLSIYPGYKAHRKNDGPEEVKKRQESRRQVDVLIRLLEIFKISVLREPSVEADDIIARLVGIHTDYQIIIVSGDHDLRQLITDKVVVVKPSIGIKNEDIFDYSKVVETYGVSPERLAELWALTGDASDNIPGIPGVGEKTALAMLKQYGSLDNVLIGDSKKVEGHRAVATMAYELIYLDGSYCKMEIPNLDFNPIEPGQDGADSVLEFLEQLDFNSIKLKWITGMLWNGNELSVGKSFKNLKDYNES